VGWRRFTRPWQLMADISSADPEYDVRGNIGRVVGDAFQVAGSDDRIQRLQTGIRRLLHDLDQIDMRGAIHVIDVVIHLANRLRQCASASMSD